LVVAEQKGSKLDWVQRRREQRRRRGDSPQKGAEGRGPKGDVIDRMLRLGGVERESRFKK
jgi:hypothetical protein